MTEKLRNISTTFAEIYETPNGNVRVEREGKKQWKVWPIGARPRVYDSKAEAIRIALSIDANPGRGGLRDVITSSKSPSTLDAEIEAFLKSKGH